MPQADFYILATSNPQEKERFICRLIEKIWLQDYRVYVFTESAEQTRRLDDLLWTFKQDSFVPHDSYPEVIQSTSPIYLSHASTLTDSHWNVLVNLSNQVPEFFNQFMRIAEIIANDANREVGRTHYRFYREQGLELNTHDINTFN